MKISVAAIGKIKEPWMKQGITEYVKRLTPFAKVNFTEYDEERWKGVPSSLLKEQIMNKEGEKLLKSISPSDSVVLLDTGGKMLSSEELASWLQNEMVLGKSQFTFMIGGPLGNGKNVQTRATLRLSLSAMTLTHQMARLILMEQLYRAMKIIHHEPYHL